MPRKPSLEPARTSSAPIEAIYDPVCGEEIARPEVAPAHTRDGVRHYFCSDRCKTRFLLDPLRYLVSGVEIV